MYLGNVITNDDKEFVTDHKIVRISMKVNTAYNIRIKKCKI